MEQLRVILTSAVAEAIKGDLEALMIAQTLLSYLRAQHSGTTAGCVGRRGH